MEETMHTKWRRIHPEGTPRLDGMVPGFEDALRYRGLVMTPLYDGETQLVWPGDWELSLQKTDEPLMDIHVSSDKIALEIATGIADRADWESFDHKPDWYGPKISEELRNFLRSHRTCLAAYVEPYATVKELGIVIPPNFDELSDIIPFPATER